MVKKKPFTSNKPLNARQKHFCINYASGMTMTAAYQKAYGCDYSTAKRKSSELMSANSLVRPYVDDLIKRKEDISLSKLVEEIMSPQEVKQRLSKLARAALADFLDKEGEPKLDKDVPSNEAATEYYHKRGIDREGNPIVTKNIKIVNPIEPLRELAKIHGMYAPSKHLVGHKVLFEMELIDGTKRLPQGGTDATEQSQDA